MPINGYRQRASVPASVPHAGDRGRVHEGGEAPAVLVDGMPCAVAVPIPAAGQRQGERRGQRRTRCILAWSRIGEVMGGFAVPKHQPERGETSTPDSRPIAAPVSTSGAATKDVHSPEASGTAKETEFNEEEGKVELMNVTVPQGAVPGQAMGVRVPSGKIAKMTVPHYAGVGTSLRVCYNSKDETVTLANDSPPQVTEVQVNTLRVQSLQKLVNQITFVYADSTRQVFGDPGGSKETPFRLENGEQLVMFTTRNGDSQDGCSFTTSTGRRSQWFGGYGGKQVVYKAAEGKHIIALKMTDGGFTMKAVGVIESEPPCQDPRRMLA